MKMEGKRPRGRPKLRWKDTVKRDMKAWSIKEEWTTDHEKWRSLCMTATLHREPAAKGKKEKVRNTTYCTSCMVYNVCHVFCTVYNWCCTLYGMHVVHCVPYMLLYVMHDVNCTLYITHVVHCMSCKSYDVRHACCSLYIMHVAHPVYINHIVGTTDKPFLPSSARRQ